MTKRSRGPRIVRNEVAKDPSCSPGEPLEDAFGSLGQDSYESGGGVR